MDRIDTLVFVNNALSARLALLVTEDLAGGDATDLEPYRPTRFTRPGASTAAQSE